MPWFFFLERKGSQDQAWDRCRDHLQGADCSSVMGCRVRGGRPQGVKRLNVLLTSPSINLTCEIMRLLRSEHFLIESGKICFIFSKSSVMSIINFTIRKKKSCKSVWLFWAIQRVGSAHRSLASAFSPTWKLGVWPSIPDKGSWFCLYCWGPASLPASSATALYFSSEPNYEQLVCSLSVIPASICNPVQLSLHRLQNTLLFLSFSFWTLPSELASPFKNPFKCLLWRHLRLHLLGSAGLALCTAVRAVGRLYCEYVSLRWWLPVLPQSPSHLVPKVASPLQVALDLRCLRFLTLISWWGQSDMHSLEALLSKSCSFSSSFNAG